MKSAHFATLVGRTALVTGASSGIGRAIADEFADAGATVLRHARTPRADAGELLLCDLSDAARLGAFCDDVWRTHGPIDVWVNNAGVDNLTGPAGGLDYAAKLQRLLDVDVRATLLLSRDIGRRMLDRGRGVILNIGWDQADRGMEGDSGELFSAAKNAVMGFTRSLALSLAPAVRVNCISPGWIRTAWGEGASELWQDRVRRETPLQRWGEPSDIAKLARFLCSDDAAYITGQVVNANGGAVR